MSHRPVAKPVRGYNGAGANLPFTATGNDI